MGFIIIVSSVFLLLFAGGIYTVSYLRKVKLNAALERNISSGLNQKTLDVLLDLIKKEPFNLKHRLQAADLLFRLKDYSEAVVQLKGALTPNIPLDPPKETSILIRLAECYRKIGQLDDALSAYMEAAKLSPKKATLQMEIARVETEKGRKRGRKRGHY